jgi:hypothetical protein
MTQPDDGLPEEIGAAMTEAGFAPTLPSLKELIANAAHEHEEGAPPAMAVARLDTIERQCRGCAARRRSRATGRRAGRRPMVLHPLDMQIWLKRTGRWFRSEAEERRWREMVGRRCSRNE